MSPPSALRTVRWMVRDTFRQAVAAKLAYVMLAVTAVCTLLCLSVGVSGLADWIQDDLFGPEHSEEDVDGVADLPDLPDQRTWVPGMDVVHEELGRGWVWGAGRGIVTVRFRTMVQRAFESAA